MRANHHRRHQDAGITVQDALFNGVITLVILASLIAVFFVVRNQHEQNEAAHDLQAILTGAVAAMANSGAPDYTSFNFAVQQQQGLLPPDDVSSTSGYGLTVPWNTTQLGYYTYSNQKVINFKIVFDSVGTCEAAVMAVQSQASALGSDSNFSWGSNPSGGYFYEGSWNKNGTTPWTPATACADSMSNGGMNVVVQ